VYCSGVDLAQLEMFVATAEAGGVQKAADRVFRTQPAVSMALRRLEEEIGAPLFDRSNRGAYVLTASGKLLYTSAKRLLRLRDETLVEVRDLHALRAGKIRIGANESTMNYLLPNLIAAFREKYPNVKLELLRQNSAGLIQEVKDNTVDLAFIAFMPEAKEIEAMPVMRDELMLIAPPGHPLHGRPSIGIADLRDFSFIAHSVPVPSRQKVIEAFRMTETPLNISMEVSTLDTIKKLVALNLGLAFIPGLCVQDELARQELIRVPLHDFQFERTLWMVRRRTESHSHAAKEFAVLAADATSKLLQPEQPRKFRRISARNAR
jgi:DNA-binding transcriptional LysR family regulator